MTDAIVETATRAVSAPLSIDALTERVALIHEASQRNMVSGVHYGVIPGTVKPTLLLPGAQLLGTLFRLRPKLTVTVDAMGGDHREYTVTADLYHDGQHEAAGVGSCSTMESKYRWRNASRVCPECNAEAIIKGKEQYGGGWVCFKKQGGCGAKFNNGDESIEAQATGKVENADVADLYNTCLKMAKKRAFIDAILTATAASSVYTQDLEDMTIPSAPEKKPTKAKRTKRETGTVGATDDMFSRFTERLSKFRATIGDQLVDDVIREHNTSLDDLAISGEDEGSINTMKEICLALEYAEEKGMPLDLPA